MVARGTVAWTGGLFAGEEMGLGLDGVFMAIAAGRIAVAVHRNRLATPSMPV